jgi:hypothetical protein
VPLNFRKVLQHHPTNGMFVWLVADGGAYLLQEKSTIGWLLMTDLF